MVSSLSFRRMLGALIPVLSILVLVGCDDGVSVDPEPAAEPLFQRFVALGNSITAGFQSDGIHSATQRTAYPVLLAERAGVEFGLPLLESPGCPPPLVNGLTGERLGGGDSTPPGEAACQFRRTPLSAHVQNLAVPGATVIDPLDHFDEGAAPNVLTQLFLGGRTQIEAAEALQPTFASVWIGNNDVLGPALSGVVEADALTSPGRFEEAYVEIVERLESAGARGGVLLGVADVTVIPYLSAGSAYWAAGQSGLLPEALTIDASCAPSQAGGIGDSVRVPAGWALETLVQPALAGQPRTLDCAGEPRVLQPEELDLLVERVEAYNAIIEEQAAGRASWTWVDLNPLFRELRASGEIPPFPDLARPDRLFGELFSLDGVHPSDSTHRIIAAEVAAAIEASVGVPLEACC